MRDPKPIERATVELLEAPSVLTVRTHEERPRDPKRPYFAQTDPVDVEYVPREQSDALDDALEAAWDFIAYCESELGDTELAPEEFWQERDAAEAKLKKARAYREATAEEKGKLDD